jgi:pSer/pThr/pTyr-binding forkhead associated (FHA) protein
VAEQVRHELVHRPLVTIGRDPRCDVVFSSDDDASRRVSKRHARIVYRARDFVLEDLASANGTLVDGEVVETVALREGDIIEIGAGGPILVVESIDVPSTPERALVEEVRRDSKRWRFVAIGAPVIALAGAAGIAWAMSGAREPAPPPVDTPAAPSEVDVFKTLLHRHESAVLFVYSRFEVRVPGREDPVFEGDSFGSGFVVLADGHAITNRHVVEPWRGDPAYALGVARARREHGEIEIVQELAAWPEGTVALTEQHGLELTGGFNSHVLKNLRIVGFPPLHTRKVDYEGEEVELVANDHTDLALLQLVGLRIDADAIPELAPRDHVLEPLDPVVSFGYPRGDEMLEGTIAAMSATRGEVSKIQETIQLHAPVYPGNSGGPVLDLEGMVVGITTRRWGEATAVCIPARMARALLSEHVAGVVR